MKSKQAFIIKNIKSSTQNSNELIHGHYFYLSDIVANGYFFSDCLIYNMIHSEMKDFFHRDLFKKKYEFRTPHALKMCFLSILIIFHTMLLSGMITNFMTIMHA